MKSLIFIATLLFLASCGNGPNGSDPTKEIGPISTEVTQDEEELIKNLSDTHQITQKDLMIKLAEFNGMSQETLNKLDTRLEIECHQYSETCIVNERKN